MAFGQLFGAGGAAEGAVEGEVDGVAGGAKPGWYSILAFAFSESMSWGSLPVNIAPPQVEDRAIRARASRIFCWWLAASSRPDLPHCSSARR